MRLATGVSGGIDSLYALDSLVRDGHEVTAVHGHFLPPGPNWPKLRDGLQAICDKLGVPFVALDLYEEFEKRIIRPFAKAYEDGLTPNPCAMCNPVMKFGLFFEKLQDELGIEHIATGHYARFEDEPPFGPLLKRGLDATKDQSYFLSLVPHERLAKAVFPLGEMLKKDIPAKLAERGLEPPLPSESQEICFIPNDDYQSFLEARGFCSKEGPFVLRDGTVLGKHKGLWRYTQGQRRGMGIAYKEPLYVVDKDIRNNAVIVGTKQELQCLGCEVRDVNFMVPQEEWPETVLIQTRYRQRAKPGRHSTANDVLTLHFDIPHDRPTPGQIAAVYSESGAVLGGGVIIGPTEG